MSIKQISRIKYEFQFDSNDELSGCKVTDRQTGVKGYIPKSACWPPTRTVRAAYSKLQIQIPEALK